MKSLHFSLLLIASVSWLSPLQAYIMPNDSSLVQPFTGNNSFDRWVSLQKTYLEEFFQVKPILKVSQYGPGMNAMASPDLLGIGDGTVEIGIILVQHLIFNCKEGKLAVLCILAHEYAHILQYKTEGYEELHRKPTRAIELQADFLAGYYYGKLSDSKLPHQLNNEFCRFFFEAGDRFILNERHHGTPEERWLAVNTGFHSAHLNLNEAYLMGKKIAQMIEKEN